MTSTSIDQPKVQELELKLQSLSSQNEVLKNGNKETLNAKYIELENNSMEAQKKTNKVTMMLEQEKAKNKKL
jgi:lysyl-tRNA synthetase class I